MCTVSVRRVSVHGRRLRNIISKRLLEPLEREKALLSCSRLLFRVLQNYREHLCCSSAESIKVASVKTTRSSTLFCTSWSCEEQYFEKLDEADGIEDLEGRPNCS